jgi:hypothetical protein
VKTPVKVGLAAVVVICLISGPIAYRHRHGIHKLLHRLKQSVEGNNPPTAASAPDGILNLNGKRFTDVLGYPPYYLTVTQYDAVLFVTRVNNGGSNLIHLMSKKGGQEEQIPTHADFGRNIGAPGGGFQDYVERAGSNELVLASETTVGQRMKTEYHLNLQTAKVDTREIFYYDPYGNITNTRVMPGF